MGAPRVPPALCWATVGVTMPAHGRRSPSPRDARPSLGPGPRLHSYERLLAQGHTLASSPVPALLSLPSGPPPVQISFPCSQLMSAWLYSPRRDSYPPIHHTQVFRTSTGLEGCFPQKAFLNAGSAHRTSLESGEGTKGLMENLGCRSMFIQQIFPATWVGLRTKR